MIGQLRHNAELHTLQAFVASEPQARIALLGLAHDAARREEAIARWRGDSGFIKFVPPLHAFAEGQSLSGRNVRPVPTMEKRDAAPILEQLCA